MLVEHILCHALKGCLLYKKKKGFVVKDTFILYILYNTKFILGIF